jgi:dodecin
VSEISPPLHLSCLWTLTSSPPFTDHPPWLGGRIIREESSMSVARVSEISSTSPQSFEDAIRQGLERATKSLRGVTAAWIKDQRVKLENGRATEYQVNMEVTFVLDATPGEPDTQGTIDQLRQGLDDLRGSVASLTARVGEGALAASSRGLQQAREMAGEVAEDVADRATEGMAAVRGRVEDRSPAIIALAFFAGAMMGSLLAMSYGRRPQYQPNRRPGGRR